VKQQLSPKGLPQKNGKRTMSEQLDYETRLKMLEMKYNQLLSRTELLQRRLSDAENALVAGGLRSKKPLA
jgi:hypothetical protein